MLLYKRGVGITGRRLARALGMRATTTWNPNIRIRWGNSGGNPIGACINQAEAIRIAAHGIHALEVLRDAGIPTIPVYRTVDDIQEYPVYSRRINHRAGKDIVICKTYQEAIENRQRFFTGYVETEREFRVHVFGGKILKMFRKVPRIPTPTDQIRSSFTGWGYSRVNLDNYKSGQAIAIEAVRALGLIFGGVDLGRTPEKTWVVFEVNTAPGLNAPTLDLYVNEFKEWLNDTTRLYRPD